MRRLAKDGSGRALINPRFRYETLRVLQQVAAVPVFFPSARDTKHDTRGTCQFLSLAGSGL